MEQTKRERKERIWKYISCAQKVYVMDNFVVHECTTFIFCTQLVIAAYLSQHSELATDWTTGVRLLAGDGASSLPLNRVQTGFGAH
jgi:hypothetical protein